MAGGRRTTVAGAGLEGEAAGAPGAAEAVAGSKFVGDDCGPAAGVEPWMGVAPNSGAACSVGGSG